MITLHTHIMFTYIITAINESRMKYTNRVNYKTWDCTEGLAATCASNLAIKVY